MLLLLFQVSALPLATAPQADPALGPAIVAQLDGPPPPAATVQMQCRVYANAGEIQDCLPLPPNGPLDDAAFDTQRREGISDRTGDIARRLARSRHLKPDQNAKSGMLQMVRLDQPVSLPPAPTLPAAEGTPLTSQRVTVTPGPSHADATALFPRAALRNGDVARIVVTCRIGIGGALACYRARVDETAFRYRPEPWIVDQFVAATFALQRGTIVAERTLDGAPTPGRDIELSVRWYLP